MDKFTYEGIFGHLEVRYFVFATDKSAATVKVMSRYGHLPRKCLTVSQSLPSDTPYLRYNYK
jgi:predicted metalloprotease with PDZ domain